MLVLSRKVQEKIQIGDQIVVTILQVKGRSVRIGIEAPRDVRILRTELSDDSLGEPEGDPAPKLDVPPSRAAVAERGAMENGHEVPRRTLHSRLGHNRIQRRLMQVSGLATRPR